MRFAALSTAFFAVCAGPAIADAPLVSGALSEAEALYARAKAIVERTPATRAQAALVARPAGPLDEFQRAAGRFDLTLQKAGEAGIPVPLGLELIAVSSYTGSAALAAATACNATHARIYLRVAREYLDDAKNGAAGLASDDWKPASLPAAQAAAHAGDGDFCA